MSRAAITASSRVRGSADPGLLYNFRLQTEYETTKAGFCMIVNVDEADVSYWTYDVGEEMHYAMVDVDVLTSYIAGIGPLVDDIDGVIKNIGTNNWSFYDNVYINLPSITIAKNSQFSNKEGSILVQGVINIEQYAFAGGGFTPLIVDIRNATTIHVDAFAFCGTELTIYANSLLATSNGGGEDAGIAVARTAGATIIYI